MGLLQQAGEEKAQRPDGSVILDMDRLSLLVDSGINSNTAAEAGTITSANTGPDAGANASPRAAASSSNFSNAKAMMHKSLTRKVSQKTERKAAAAADGGNRLPTTAAAAVCGGGAAPSTVAAFPPATTVPDKLVAMVLSPAAAPEATVAAAASPRQAAPCRRAHGRRAASLWLDPRRVLLFFATLSSMGTIILLYFMLSMGKMGDGDADAR